MIVPAVFADADIDAVQINRQKGETVVKIDASSHFQFTHQIEEAKDGRPFRVIVDFFPAVHKLGQNSFFDLPESIVKAVRSSQYAVSPNKTVRVVLDLNKESMYRIEKSGNAIFVYIPDAAGKDFPVWASTDHIRPAAPAVKPTIKKDNSEKTPVMAKTESAPKVEVRETPPLADKPESTYFKPEKSGLVEKEWSQPFPLMPAATPAVARADAKPVVKEEAPTKPVSVEKPKPEKTKPVKTDVDKGSPKVAPKTEYAAAPKPAAPVIKPEKEKTAKVETKPAAKTPTQENPAELVVEEKPEPKKIASDKKPTSRFRRQPAFPAKLKGTIVAEFPKRMVIKYKPGQSRDPFASLMDESKGTDSPLDKRIPDVETARLVGILESADGQNRALLEDLDGYGFILKPGDKIKKGYVSQIYSDKALFQIFEYGWSRSVALHLDEIE